MLNDLPTPTPPLKLFSVSPSYWCIPTSSFFLHSYFISLYKISLCSVIYNKNVQLNSGTSATNVNRFRDRRGTWDLCAFLVISMFTEWLENFGLFGKIVRSTEVESFQKFSVFVQSSADFFSSKKMKRNSIGLDKWTLNFLKINHKLNIIASDIPTCVKLSFLGTFARRNFIKLYSYALFARKILEWECNFSYFVPGKYWSVLSCMSRRHLAIKTITFFLKL